jgi:hypothetical protein
VPRDERLGLHRAAGKVIETDLHQPHTWTASPRTSTAGEPGGRCPTPASSAVATRGGPARHTTRSPLRPVGPPTPPRSPATRLPSRRRLPTNTPQLQRSNAGAAACGGASRPAPPARAPVRTSRRPQGKEAGGDPPGTGCCDGDGRLVTDVARCVVEYRFCLGVHGGGLRDAANPAAPARGRGGLPRRSVPTGRYSAGVDGRVDAAILDGRRCGSSCGR